MAKKLVMSFVTALGGKASYTIDEPKAGLTEAEVRETMNLFLTKNIFNTTKGDLTDIKAAEVITTTAETLIQQ